MTQFETIVALDVEGEHASVPEHGAERIQVVAAGKGGDPRRMDAPLITAEHTRELGAFLGPYGDNPAVACVAHNAPVVRDVLCAAGLAETADALIDTKLVAQIAYPTMSDLSLPALRDAVELQSGPGEGPARCGLMLDLFSRLVARLASLPPAVLAEINQVLCFCHERSLRMLLKTIASGTREQAPLENGALLDLFPEVPRPRPRGEIAEGVEWSPIDVDGVCNTLGPGGPFAGQLPAYEDREGQVAMARAVAEAFNGSRHLLAEAGTGIGKSLAYLVPSVLWAQANATPVIVSTNTKNLQSQLFDKDLPMVSRVLGGGFKAALIKGRMNYLCLRKLFSLLRQSDAELDAGEESLLLAMVLVWLSETPTGDFAEMASWDHPGTARLTAKLTATSEECRGRACSHFRRCFLWTARARAQAADIVVANHSLVFAEMNMRSPALPPHAHMVFDEVHNLEDAATRHFSVEVSTARIRFVLNRLLREGRGRRRTGSGLIPSVTRALTSGAVIDDGKQRARAVGRAKAAADAIRKVRGEMDPFFESLGARLDRHDGETLRLRADAEPLPEWDAVLAAKRALIGSMAHARQAITALSDCLRDAGEDGLPFQLDLVRDLDAMSASIGELSTDIDFVLAADDPEFVYWIERAPRRQGSCRAWAAPIAIGPQLHRDLYARKASIVFCSATLTVGRSFNFIKRRLGMAALDVERLAELDAGSPFDYPNQCVALVPVFLPEPGSDGNAYAEALGVLLADVFRCTRGRAMALFTSYGMLKHTTGVLTECLAADPIQVLSQGHSGSREHITETFRQDLESVLMGTHSFWEGVDLVGETLSCLVVARLPFAVYTDPIQAARAERVEAEGESAFAGYSLPNAVIRFRQGFGRLIRHRTDRGVVIVADRRIVGRRYGSWFRKSLPVRTVAISDRSAFLQAIGDFLAEG